MPSAYSVRAVNPGGLAVVSPDVGPEVHACAVEPAKERLAGLDLTLDEIQGGSRRLVVDGFHALPRQRPGVLDLPVGGGLDDPSRSELLAKFGVSGVVAVLWLLFGVQVIQVAEELVEPVITGQELVLVPKMILPELAGRIPEWFEQLGDRRVFLL